MKDGGHSVGSKTSAARRCRACSAARTVARWNMQVTDAEVQHSKNSSNGLRRAQGWRAPADCPHIGAGAGRLSACSVRLPFAGEIGAMRVMLGSLERFASRRAQAWPSGSRLRRRKDPERMLAGAGRTTRSSVYSGSVPRGVRRTGANGWTVAHSTRSCGAQMSSKERRCSNEPISTSSPVGLQACYIGSAASRPANSMQCEGKSAKVWLITRRGG